MEVLRMKRPESINVFKFLRTLGLLGYIKILADERLINAQWQSYVMKNVSEWKKYNKVRK